MHLKSNYQLCDICKSLSENTYQNQICKHCYCLRCFRKKDGILKICLVTQCDAQIKQNEITSFFQGDQRPQKEEQTLKFNNNSTINVEPSTKSQINSKSKQYTSPYQSNFDFKQQQTIHMKMDVSDTLNYCAICLFYIKDDLLKQQVKLNQMYQVLNCQQHTICVGCFSRYVEFQKNKQYFCEICQRLIK